MNRRRLQAFTIMEVTVAMLIAAIAIGITYTVYSIVVKSYSNYIRKNKDMAVVLRLDELMKKDFERADNIFSTGNHLSFISPEQTISYDLEPNFVLRTGITQDTFKVNVPEYAASFENVPLPGSDVSQEQRRLDELEMTILFETKTISYHYKKQYSSASLIQNNADARY